MYFRNFSSFFVLSFVFALTSAASSNPVQDEMREFFDSNGILVNTTDPGKYKTQAASHYTLGSVYARTPIKNTQLASLSLPSARAGCGGIDLFGGAFSFLNADELINTMKAIGNNALALSFQLAIESISPVIAEKIEDLRQLQQEINSLNINSCETAAVAIGSIWEKTDASNRTLCSVIGNRMGRFSDYAASRHGCTSGGDQASTLNAAGGEYDAFALQDINYAWSAILKSGIAQRGGSLDRDLAEMIMTLTGTIIIDAPTSDTGRPSFQYVGQKADSNTVLDALFAGGTLRALRCDTLDNCLNPVVTNRAINEENSMYGYVDVMIDNLRTRLVENSALQPDELAFLNRMTIPVYKILRVEHQYASMGAVVDDRHMKELIALDLLYSFVEERIKYMRGAIQHLRLQNDQHVGEFREQLKTAMSAVRGRRIDESNRTKTATDLIERTQFLEKRLASSLSVRAFSEGL